MTIVVSSHEEATLLGSGGWIQKYDVDDLTVGTALVYLSITRVWEMYEVIDSAAPRWTLRGPMPKNWFIA